MPYKVRFFYQKKLLIKMWKFEDKKYPKAGAYLGEFWAIFLKKLRQTPKKSPKWRNFAQSGHADMILPYKGER
jgi:hypothetical protein